jgi:hypothetical protein
VGVDGGDRRRGAARRDQLQAELRAPAHKIASLASAATVPILLYLMTVRAV